MDGYVAKFRANVAGVLAPSLADETIDTLLRLDTIDNVAALFDKLSHC